MHFSKAAVDLIRKLLVNLPRCHDRLQRSFVPLLAPLRLLIVALVCSLCAPCPRAQHSKATKRLGVVKGGAKLIKEHPWFKGFDWCACRPRVLGFGLAPPLTSLPAFAAMRWAAFSPGCRAVFAAQGCVRAARNAGADRHAGQEQRGSVQL